MSNVINAASLFGPITAEELDELLSLLPDEQRLQLLERIIRTLQERNEFAIQLERQAKS